MRSPVRGRLLLTFARTALVAVAAASSCGVALLGAQGVTTASIRGTVLGPRGSSLDGTAVRVVNEATGFVAPATVRNGTFLAEGLETGGPYSIEVRRIGFVPARRTGISLHVGERYSVDVVLEAIAAGLDTLRVTTGAPTATRATAGGVGTSISESTLRRLPTLNADMYDFVRLAPQVGTRFGLSGAGSGFRLNNFVIDGVSDRQLQGNNAPGGAAGSKGISIEAVKEYQVLLAPFDARYGDFTGLLVNSVTKSGTNDLHGSVYGSLRNARLARAGSFLGISDYDRELYGFSLGGPIVHDHVQYFVAAELQRAAQPARGPYIGQPADAATPVPPADSVARFASLLRDRGIDAGDGGRVTLPNPTGSFFGRVDVALPRLRSRLVLRENFSRAEFSGFARPEQTSVFSLSSVAGTTRVTRQTLAVQLFSQLAPTLFSEFQAGYTDSPITGAPYAASPSISVSVRTTTGTAPGTTPVTTVLSAGPGPGGQGGGSKQFSVEVGEHLAFQPGAAHTFGFGAHVEFFRYHIAGTRNTFGAWTFPSLDSLARGAASQFTLGRDFGSAEAPVAGAQPSAYISDDWRPNDRLSLSLGLRVDAMTFSQQPALNPVVEYVFARRTSDYPSFHPQWSPRFGFTWDADSGGRTRLRGGAGIFTGRPPLGWLVGPMRSNGAGVRTLTCGAGRVPAFTPYPAAQPSACADGSGFSNGPVTLVDRDLRMGESFRASLAVERRLPWNIQAGVEALYTGVRSDFVFSNLNLKGPVGVGAHGRVMYGTITAAGVGRPARVDSLFGEVVGFRNQPGGSSWSVTAQVQKPWSDHLEMRASYTYSRVRDVQSLTSGSATAPLDIWASGRPLSGRADDWSTGTSAFEIPHRVVLAITYTARWRGQATDLSLYYVGESGAPFTYGDSTGSGKGDLNADSTNVNDPIYVPRNATDPAEIVFANDASGAQAAAFEKFIHDTPCLQRQRGSIVARNSCRGPWVHTSNLSVRQSLPGFSGHVATIQLDVFNLLNLLDGSWGRFEVPNRWILQQAGQTIGAAPQPTFTFSPALASSHQNAESGYQVQLSVRYGF